MATSNDNGKLGQLDALRIHLRVGQLSARERQWAQPFNEHVALGATFDLGALTRL
jgi:hypothetical protein